MCSINPNRLSDRLAALRESERDRYERLKEALPDNSRAVLESLFEQTHGWVMTVHIFAQLRCRAQGRRTMTDADMNWIQCWMIDQINIIRKALDRDDESNSTGK